MKKLNVLIALTTNDNDYQLEQAQAAEEAARRLGISIQIIHADNDAINQSQQILKIIQSSTNSRPDAVVFEPVGATALPQVARAAVTAGIGWGVLKRDVDYLVELRTYPVPCFAISSDHEEIGRIQGRQFGALLPKGGTVLYIQGPSETSAAQDRAAGMQMTISHGVQIVSLRGRWTEESAQKAVESWLRLNTSNKTQIDVVGAQNDLMAMGARKAFEGVSNIADREKWLRLPFTGVDGLAKTGMAWVRNGTLTATVVVPTNEGQAIFILAEALKTGKDVPERSLTTP